MIEVTLRKTSTSGAGNLYFRAWQIAAPHIKEDVQRDFLKYTAQMIIRHMKHCNSELLNDIKVDAKDRKYQVWERNALSVPIWTEAVLKQKMEYMHANPVKAGLCSHQDEYYYSSSRFYNTGIDRFGMLSHYHYD